MSDWPVTFTRKWKLGEPGAAEVILKNVADYDRVRGILPRRCKVPDCGYVIANLTGQEMLELPEFGPVCGVCYYMHSALQSIGLKSPYYFRNLHQEWKREQKEGRGRMGLGGLGGSGGL